jgi:hypothetical protein
VVLRLIGNMGDIIEYLITIYWPKNHISVSLQVLESKVGKNMFLRYLTCIHVWGTPLGLSLEDML